MSKLPVSAILALTSALAISANAIDAIFEDNQVNIIDLARLPALLNGIKGLIDVDFSQVAPEALDIDEVEKAQLADAFRASFNIRNDAVENVIEIGFGLLLEAAQVVQILKEIGSKIKH